MKQANILLEDLQNDWIAEDNLSLELFYMIEYEDWVENNSVNEVFIATK